MIEPGLDSLLERLEAHSPECQLLVGIIRRLLSVIEEQRAEENKLRLEIARLNAKVSALTEQLEEERRKNGRPTAPFRLPDEKRAKDPKKPGRPPGHKGSFRAKPDYVDEEIEVPLDKCSKCHGALTNLRPVEQFIEEIPPTRCKVIHLVTYEGVCPSCGPVRSTHPLQVSTATGAAGTHLGPNATGLAVSLLHDHAITKRKTAKILNDIAGLSISPGGLVHLAHRVAKKLRPQYEDLLREALEATVMHSDETSWWVGGPGSSLWVFTNPNFTIFCIRPTRGRVVLYEILGPDFMGVLVSDCLSVYDEATALQHKCYAHHLKAVSAMLKRAPHTAEYCADIRKLLGSAMLLKKLRNVVPEEAYAASRSTLVKDARRLFVSRRADSDEERLANRFRKQLDHLFTFLDYDEVDATNNLAERQLRPAVVSRKVSCGNKTWAGAATWEVLASLAATSRQRGEDFIRLVSQAALLNPG